MHKRFLSDVVINVSAAALPVLALQIVVLPVVNAFSSDAESYGVILTAIAVLSAIPRSVGNALNNIRLVSKSDVDSGASGEFNGLVLISSVAAAVLATSLVVLLESGSSNPIVVTLFFVAALMYSAREYYIVAFRVRLSFRSIFLDGAILGSFYLVGLAVFAATGYWPLIFVIGYGASLCYSLVRGGLASEGWSVSSRMRRTSRKFLWLLAATLVASVITYADRLILFPVLGGESVAVYFVAAMVGKIVTMVATPVGGVVLAYIAGKKAISGKRIGAVVGIAALVSLAFYLPALLIAHPVISLLYPDLAPAAAEYLPFTTATAMLTLMLAVINPYLIKFRRLSWQFGLNSVVVVLYLGAAIILSGQFGLLGFVLAAMGASASKVVLRLAVLAFGKDRGDG